MGRFLVAIIVFTSLQAAAQQQHRGRIDSLSAIDHLNSEAEIKDLLRSIDELYDDFEIAGEPGYLDQQCQRLSDSLQIMPYVKADFDNNGFTDLLINGKWDGPMVLCVLGNEDGRLSIKRLTRENFQDCSFALVDTAGSQTYIDYYYFASQEGVQTNMKRLLSRRLVYKFGDFIELSSNSQRHQIEKIRYNTTGCFGTCPIFTIVVRSDRTATYKAVRYNKPDGEFKGTIDKKSYNDLVALLNYINFPDLKTRYEVNWTDDQSCGLIITYDNGKEKIISDYGLIGTFGLNRVYQMFYALRKSQSWKRAASSLPAEPSFR